MPRVNPILPTFSSGEAGPRMAARVDFENYSSTSETALNLLSLPQGGFMRRPGTRYVAEVKNSANATYLMPFEFNVEQAYVVEGGANYFRFFRDQGQLTVSDTDAVITNGTFDSDISDWDDRSTGGSAVISHDSTNNRLSLDGDGTNLAIAEQDVAVTASFQNSAHVLRFEVYGVPGDFITLRIGTTSTGTEVVNDVYFGVGYHAYTFTPGATTFYVQFVNSLGKSITVDNVDLLDNQALELVTPFTAAQIQSVSRPQANDVMYLFTGGTTPPYKLQRLADTSWSLEEVNFLDGPYLDQNIVDPILPANATTGLGFGNQGGSILTGASSTTLAPAATTGLGIALTASDTAGINNGQGFLSTDVGRLVRIQQSDSAEAGYGIITAVSTTTSATIDIRRDFNVTTATTRWWLGALSETTGYPLAGTFHEQRLVMGSSNDFPQSLWFSQSADIENQRPDSFVAGELTVESDDAINISLASREANTIQWVESSRLLSVGTSGGEWVIQSSGAVITPLDIQASRHAKNGSAAIQPIQIDDTVIFVQRAKRKLFDFSFVFERDSFKGRDLTILSHRAAGSGINQMDYQQEPDSIVWGVRSDGLLGSMTYKPQDNVVSWTRQKLGGSFSTGDAVAEGIAIIPGEAGGGRTLDSDERDEVWVTVKRTINGATERYVEFFERVFEGPLEHDFATEAAWEAQMLSDQEDAFYVDSGLSYDGASTTTLSGLDHLEGETVKILANGAIHPDKTVSSGSITLDYAVTKAQVGLGYTHTYKSLKLPFGASAGTAVGKAKRIHKVTFVLLDTATFMFGKDANSLKDVEFREVEDAMDTAVPLFVGEKSTDFGGQWSTDSRMVIESDNPSPFVMLAIAPEMKTNDIK